jgi:uncharacterized membrane protein YjjP (DUF1212 family)
VAEKNRNNKFDFMEKYRDVLILFGFSLLMFLVGNISYSISPLVSFGVWFISLISFLLGSMLVYALLKEFIANFKKVFKK